MNREIKFRAWDGKQMEFNPTMWGFKENDGVNDVFTTNGSVFMQFTGLYDCNKTPIYEGDILKDRYGNVKEVRFSTELGSCGCCFEAFGGSGFMASGITIDESFGLPEVIGNVWENPELL